MSGDVFEAVRVEDHEEVQMCEASVLGEDREVVLNETLEAEGREARLGVAKHSMTSSGTR